MLNLIPHRLGHFLIIKLHGAVGGDMGHRFVIPVFFLQPVPDSEAVPQMSMTRPGVRKSEGFCNLSSTMPTRRKKSRQTSPFV